MDEEKLVRRKHRALAENNNDLLANTHKKLGELYMSLGRYDEALEEYKEEKQVWNTLGRAIHSAIADRMIGEIYSMLGQYKEALRHLKEYFEIAKAESDMIEEQRALATIGRTYFCMAESISDTNSSEYSRTLREAKQAYILSLKVCDKLNNVDRHELLLMRSRLMLNIGLVHECEGDVEKAVGHIEKAIAINKKADLFEDTYRCYSSMAALYQRQNEPALSLKYYDLALEIAERLPERAQLMSETLLSKTEVYFSQTNYHSAKQASLKAYKIPKLSNEQKRSAENFLKIAVLLCDTEEKLMRTRDDDYETRKKLYEIMGDTCCFVKNYKKAITYYLKMLECAENLGCFGKDLLPALVSLSQTYRDAGDYTKAIEFLERELEVWGNNEEEACKTSLNIVQLLEQKGEGFSEIMGVLKKAYNFALVARNEKLELKVLTRMLECQRGHGQTELAEETEKKIELFKAEFTSCDSSDGESGSDTEEIPDTIRNVSLSDVLDETENTDEESSRPRQVRRQQHSLKLKRNEKGETQLQVACIAGNVQRVKKLIEMGHPVNVTDNGGWTPLHEACNHGYVELVSLLLDHGANINDPGGDGCEGLTPLHDACFNGHLSIVEILLDRGALIDVRTNDNKTPLDCLMDWSSRSAGVPATELSLFEILRERLQTGLEKAGVSTESADSRPVKEMRKHKRDEKEMKQKKSKHTSSNLRQNIERERSRNRNWTVLNSESSESEEEVLTPTLEENTPPFLPDDVSEDMDPAVEYQRVIQGLRTKQIHERSRKSPDHTPQTGVFLADDDVTDDWLIDDIQDRPCKRRKTKEGDKIGVQFIGPSVRSSAVASETTPQSPPSVEADSNKENDLEEVMDIEDDYHPVARIPVHHPAAKQQPQQRSLLEAGFSCLAQDKSSDRSEKSRMPEPNTHKMKVRVQDIVLVVPVPAQELALCTVDWLAKQAAQRYLKLEGREPSLAMFTSDGAVLAADDPLSLVNDNREFRTSVTAWKLASLNQRYRDACSDTGIEPNLLIEKHLQSCECSSKLDLNDCSLHIEQLTPVIKALRYQNDLECLHLGGNAFMDAGVEMLCTVVKELPMLQDVDLSCNYITSGGLKLLTNFLITSQALVALNLNYNEFGNDWLENISAICNSAPHLRSLKLQACGLTSDAFRVWRGSSPPLSSISSLEILDISYNPLGESGVNGFLQQMNASNVVSLNIAGTASSHSKTVQKVTEFLKSACPQKLESLNISDCFLTDEEFEDLSRLLNNASKLKALHMSNNVQMTCVSMNVLSSMTNLPATIDLSGCDGLDSSIENSNPKAWLCDEFFQKLEALTLTHEVKQLDRMPQGGWWWMRIEECWRKVWDHCASIHSGPSGLLHLSLMKGIETS